MKTCAPCKGSGWQQTSEDRIMPGLREGVCCSHCHGIGEVPCTADEIAAAEKNSRYKMHSIVVGTKNSPKKAVK